MSKRWGNVTRGPKNLKTIAFMVVINGNDGTGAVPGRFNAAVTPGAALRARYDTHVRHREPKADDDAMHMAYGSVTQGLRNLASLVVDADAASSPQCLPESLNQSLTAYLWVILFS